MAERGWEQVIVKPAVDLGAMNLVRTDAAGVSAAIADMNGAFLVQPYLPSLERDGELSVVGLGGEVTYTLRKRPADGDFRVQPQYGGEHAGVSAPAGVLGVAASAMAVVRRRGDPLYWRVDMVRGLDGDWRCIEVELIEPALFLDVGEGAADRLAELLVQ